MQQVIQYFQRYFFYVCKRYIKAIMYTFKRISKLVVNLHIQHLMKIVWFRNHGMTVEYNCLSYRFLMVRVGSKHIVCV
jgi:hypothetical protein